MPAAVAPVSTPVQREAAWRPAAWRLWAALGVVLAVAAFTRLWRLDLIDFKADEAQIARLALEAANGRWPATSIQTSGGIFNPPLPVYFFGLAALFTHDPAWQAAVIALLDILGVLAVFFIGRRYFCGRVGLAAAAFYAANAYATIFARKLAGPFLQPLFAALLLAVLLENARQNKEQGTKNKESASLPLAWTWGVAIFLLAILVQFHLGALLLVPVIAVLFVLSRPTWREWASAAVGLALAAGLFAPYLAYELSQQPDFIPGLLSAAGGTPGWGFGAFRLIWVTITSPGYGDLTGTASSMFNSESWPAGFVTPLAGIAVLGGMGVALWRWRDRRFLTLVVFTLLPPLLMLHSNSAARIHYFVFLEPAIFLLAGVGFDALLATWPRLRGLAFALLALLLAIQTANLAHFTGFIQQHALPADGYGLPLAYQERLFEHARQLAGSNGRIITAVDGRNQADPAAYFARGMQHAEVDTAIGSLVPAGRAVYVTFGQQTPPLIALSRALHPGYVEELPSKASGAVYEVQQAGNATISYPSRTSEPAEWRNGLSLSSGTAGGALPTQLVAIWHVAHDVNSSTTIFNQVVDDSGKQWFDDDSLPVSASAWQAGDTLLIFKAARLPADAPLQEYWWVVGMYEDGGRRVLLANGDSEFRVTRLKGGNAQPSGVDFKAVDATFGSAIQLTGYAIDANSITLRWASLRAVDRDYTVFVHTLDASGKVLAQADGQPSGGHYPTSLWEAGETVFDRHVLTISAGSHLEVGLYDLASGQRLKQPNGSDHVTLPAT